MSRIATLISTALSIALVSVCPWLASAQDDSAARLCLSLLQIDIKDTNQVFADEDHFNEFKSALQTANFNSYKDLEKAGGSLGLDIPIAKAIIGLSASAENDTGIFQQEMAKFLSTSYSKRMDRGRFQSVASHINSQLLSVAQECNSKYFETLKDRIRLSIEVEPQSYGKFVIKMFANTPQTMTERLVINQIEPADLITCTENGKALSLGTARPDNQALLNCAKDENQQILLVFRTNLGSPTIRLPSKPTQQSLASTKPLRCAIGKTGNSAAPQAGERIDILLDGEPLGYLLGLKDGEFAPGIDNLVRKYGYPGEHADRGFLTFDCYDGEEHQLTFKRNRYPEGPCTATVEGPKFSHDISFTLWDRDPADVHGVKPPRMYCSAAYISCGGRLDPCLGSPIK
jgi:hypothetical protein